MDESKLPPGPWKVEPYGSDIRDANGDDVLWIGNADALIAPAQVFRAIEALPLLVEAARIGLQGYEALEAIVDGRAYSSNLDELREMLRRNSGELRDVLALVDGEDQADG